MNYYERVDKAIDYIEEHLQLNIELNDVSKQAYMSLTSFYRMFFSLTGYQVKTYIRNRRFSEACKDIMNGKKVIDIAFIYGYSSHEAFTRSFKKVIGVTPSYFKKFNKPYRFERIKIMEKYCEIQDEVLINKYPNIKVLKALKPQRVAYYRYYGKEPENGAFKVMSDWLQNSGLEKLRIFGFNNPHPLPGENSYGYEVWVTIPEDFQIKDEKIKSKTFQGGLYAVTHVDKNDDIKSTWKRLKEWLKHSKYGYGTHQWLEEHLDFDDDFNHIGGIDLYIPIKEEKKSEDYKIVTIKPKTLAYYKSTGPNAVMEARQFFIEWLKENEYLNGKREVISWYNYDRIGKDDHFCIIGIEKNNLEIKDKQIKTMNFEAGAYLLRQTQFKDLEFEWNRFLKWMNETMEYKFGNHQFFETFILNNKGLSMKTDTFLYMPIQKITRCH